MQMRGHIASTFPLYATILVRDNIEGSVRLLIPFLADTSVEVCILELVIADFYC